MADSNVFRPEWVAFEKEIGFRPIVTSSVYEEMLAQDQHIGMTIFSTYAKHLPAPDPAIKLSEHKTTATGVRVKVYTPSNARHDQPAVCYIHGGGFTFGNVDQDDSLVSRFAKDTGLVFASVEYRLAPQHPFPAGLDDCIEVAKWCVDGSLLGTNGKVVLMGGSAGGALALATTLKLIDGGLQASVQGVVPCQPMTLHPDAVPTELAGKYTSYEEHAHHTINSSTAMHAFFGFFGAPKTDPYMSCLNSPRLKELPRVYMNACGCDTLRDDARLLKAELDKLGYDDEIRNTPFYCTHTLTSDSSVPNSYDEYHGLPHFFYVFPSPLLDGVRDEYFAKTVKGIEFVLQKA